MTIALSLDRDALEALFPEGSEVRLQLRGAVLDQAVKRYAAKDWPEIQQQVKRITDSAFREALATQGLRVTYGNTVQLSEEIKTAMRQQAKELIQQHMAEELDLSPERLRLLRDDLMQVLGLRITQELSGPLFQQITQLVVDTMKKFLTVQFNPAWLQAADQQGTQG
jgi:hypothetical protein